MQKINGIVPIVSVEASRNPELNPTHAAVGIAIRLKAWIVRWQRVRKSRKALCHLTSDQLRDIGLTRSEATREYRRSYYID